MREKLLRLLLLGCFASVVPWGGIADAAGEVPDLIPSDRPDRTAPVWRSAAALAGEAGIEWQLLTQDEKEKLQGRLAKARARAQELQGSAGEPCAAYGPSRPQEEELGSLEEAVVQAKAIYAGTVLGFKEGLYFDSPSTLYELSVDAVLSSPEGAAPIQRILVYYPAARFALGDQKVCREALRGPERPQIGGRMLVLAGEPALGDGSVVVPADGLLFQGEDGSLSAPAAWRALSGLSSDALSVVEDQIHELAGGGR